MLIHVVFDSAQPRVLLTAGDALHDLVMATTLFVQLAHLTVAHFLLSSYHTQILQAYQLIFFELFIKQLRSLKQMLIEVVRMDA